MNLKIKKVLKKIIITIILLSCIIFIFSIIREAYIDNIKNTAYIDIYIDTPSELSPAVYENGRGITRKRYLGLQPLHYLVKQNGKVYTYKAGSFQSEVTKFKYIKTLSKNDLNKLEKNLKLILENNTEKPFGLDTRIWHIKIEGNHRKVNYEELLKESIKILSK